MQSEKTFQQYYNTTIQPELRRLDKQRVRLLRWLLMSSVFLLAVAVFTFWLKILVVALVFCIPAVLYLGYLWRQIQKFRQEFKPRIMRLVLDFMDDGLLFGELKYDQHRKIPLVTFINSQIFGVMPAVYEGEDYISGRIGDIEFELCELKVEEFSRVRARLDPVFRGIFINAVFKHPPKGTLLVLPRTQLPQLANSVKSFVAMGGINVEGLLRHAEFKKVYTVFGTRNVRIDALLTKELMDFILHFRQRNGEMYLSFYGKNIFAGIVNEKDILEPKLFQSNVSYDLVREFYEDVYVALNLVMAFDEAH